MCYSGNYKAIGFVCIACIRICLTMTGLDSYVEMKVQYALIELFYWPTLYYEANKSAYPLPLHEFSIIRDIRNVSRNQMGVIIQSTVRALAQYADWTAVPHLAAKSRRRLPGPKSTLCSAVNQTINRVGSR